MKKLLLLALVCMPIFAKKRPSFKKTYTQQKKRVSASLRSNRKRRRRQRSARTYLSQNANNFFNSDMEVRVLLERFSKINDNKWNLELQSEKGFIIQAKGSEKKVLIRDKQLNFDVLAGNLYIKNDKSVRKKVKNTITLYPVSEKLSINGDQYSGSLTIDHQYNKPPKIINNVSLDDYVYSVLRYETFQSWPLEMHKVQAVISRTYALHHITNARKRKKIYDVKSTNFHQCYNGHHPYTHLRKAVNQTKNMILSFNKKPALTMFDVCCGGVIPANVKGLNFNDAPYLARKKQCLYCKNYKLFSWKKEISFNEFMENLHSHKKLKPKLKNVGSIKDIKILKKDKSGVVHKLKLNGTMNSIVCSGKNFIESMKNSLKSLSFKVKKKKTKGSSGNIVFSGNGFGHLVGLCQMGAHSLVKKGWKYKEILGFYYPKTRLGKVDKINYARV